MQEIKESSRILVVGDTPTPEDLQLGRPYAGTEGQILARWMHGAGIERKDCSFVYVGDWSTGMGPAVRVIVPLGEEALTAVTGKRGLYKWRGSLLTTEDGAVRVVASLDPLDSRANPDLAGQCRADWKRIRDESFTEGPPAPPPERVFTIFPTKDDIDAFLQHLKDAPDSIPLSVDIETNPKKKLMYCVGFSLDPASAICIPWTTSKNKSAIREALTHPRVKLFHNGGYDTYWLHRLGAPVTGYKWDTLYMHHALHPSDTHSLAYLASLFTRQPFWKDDPKDGLSSSWELLGSPEDFYRYNCMDAAVTLELWGVLKGFLEEHGLLEYYRNHYAALFEPLLRAGLHGMRVNAELRATREQENNATVARLFAELAEKAGHDMRGKGKRKGEVGKGLSTGKIAAFLYGSLGLPVPKVKGDDGRFVEKRKTDEVTIRRATLNTEEMREIGPLILQVRRHQQLGAFLNADRYVEDRLYYQFKMNTEAGRLSSSMNPFKEGSNLQNQDREVRDMFWAEPGQLIMEMDASQIESRYVYAMTGDPRLYELANAKPWEADMHKENAAAMFGVSLANVTKEQRQSGKIVSHGCQRDMQGKRLSDTYLKDHNMLVPKEECQKQINAYHAARPAIKRWFASVRSTLTTHRRLTNSWGRTLYFPYDRFDASAYRRAYSFYPQSECADHLNQLGVRVWYERLASLFPGAVLLGQVHDSLIWSVYPAQAWGIYTRMRMSLEQPRMVSGVGVGARPLVVPMETKIGLTWAGSIELKKPPSQADFLDMVMALPTAPLWG